MSQLTTLEECAYCPFPQTADGTLVDRCGDTVSVCLDCLVYIWSSNWAGLERKVLADQVFDMSEMEQLRHYFRLRRRTRRWVNCVRRLSEGSTPRERAQAARRRLVRGGIHTLTLRPERLPGETSEAFVAATWRHWLTNWILHPTSTKGAHHG